MSLIKSVIGNSDSRPSRRVMLAAAAIAVCSVGSLSFGLLPDTKVAVAAEPHINTIGLKGVAIKGYDPVAYFRDGGPHKGSPNHAVTFEGAEWRFKSAENKALFEEAPEKYVPAYGGFCAYGVAKGVLVKIEPEAWSIRGGKLYLNYDLSVQANWNKKPDEYISVADRKWPQLIRK